MNRVSASFDGRLRWMGAAALGLLLSLPGVGQSMKTARGKNRQAGGVLMWINHLDFLPGDPSVTVSFDATSSGVGAGLSGLIIQSSTLGGRSPDSRNKVIEKGLQVPPGFLIKGVRVCYELSNSRTHFAQIRLDQVQDPPNRSIVRLEDSTPLTAVGPLCADSQNTTVDSSRGAVRLSFRINAGNTGDRIVLRAVGLHLEPSS